MKRPWFRLFVERFALVLFGLVLAILLLEIGLRIAASFVGHRSTSGVEGQKTRILTLGDSHTYGVFYDAPDSYPGQLQALLDQRAPDRYQVINLGLPGMNSSEIVARLPAWITRYRPTAVVVCSGINNVWNQSDTEIERSRSTLTHWFDGWRITRMIRLLRINVRHASSTPPPVERPEIERVLLEEGKVGVEHRDRTTGELLIRHEGNLHERLGLEEARNLLEKDLRQMVEITETWGVRLVLLTYSAFPLPGRTPYHQGAAEMSAELREAAAEFDLTLVDPHDRFLALLEGQPRSFLFHTETEGHPNPRGYREIAQMVAEVFEP